MQATAVRKQAPAPAVAAVEVEKLLALRETQKAIKARLAVMDEAIDTAEAELMAQIEAGADFSNCGYQVAILTSERRYPAWRAEFEARLGKPLAEKVLSETVPTLTKKLQIK